MCRRPTPSSRLRALVFVTTLATLASVTLAARADGEVVERVVAVVNSEAIFLSEMRRRAAPFLAQAMQAPSQRERAELIERLYREVLDHLIDDELIKQAARRMSIRVTDADLERAVRNVQQQNELSDAEFWEAVEAQGYSASQYRSDLRRQLLRLKVINQRVRGRVNITEDDVRREYDQSMRRDNRRLRFRASHVFFPLSANASATEVASVRARANALRAELTPARFSDAAAEYGGGELGWLSQGDLPRDLEDVLLTLSPGQLSAPTRGASGFHIFLLHDRESSAASGPQFDDVKDEIYRRMLDESMTRQEALFLEELRRDAVVRRRH